MRFVIYGNSGSGKTALARELALRAGIDVLELDRIAREAKAARQGAGPPPRSRSWMRSAPAAPIGSSKVATATWCSPRCTTSPNWCS